MVLALLAAACGKKGPPLAPIIRIPAAVQALAAQRVGNDVYLTVTMPSQNIDATTPAAVRRVDVYAYTGRENPGARLMAAATLVASIFVAEVPLDRTGQPLPPMPRPGEALQGERVTVVEALGVEALTPRPLPPLAARRRAAPIVLPATPPGVGPPSPPQRFYTAIGFSDRGRNGPVGLIVAVPLGVIPDPPTGLIADITTQAVALAWEPAGGLLGFMLDRELPPEVPPVDESTFAAAAAPVDKPIASTFAAGAATVDRPLALAALPPGPTRYNVFREMAPDPLELPQGVGRPTWTEIPVPLNAVPLETFSFEDALQADGRERCYHVRAVRGVAPAAVQGDGTARVCFTPVDTEPPATPTGLTVAVDDGAMTLLWDPNVEEDLAGYLVLRGVAGDATLTLLTERPVASARYVDRAVTPGTRYVYFVKAVDNRVPLGNVSPESNRAEETAR